MNQEINIEHVWNDYGSLLRGFLVSRVNNPDDAEDLLQEILIKTHKQLDSLKDPGKFKSWLFQIARNTLIDYYRKPERLLSSESLPELADVRHENAQEAMRRELSHCIQPFVENLPKAYREAIEAVDLQGQSQKELAAELKLSHSAMKSRVQRGRQKLAALFKECCTYEMDARGNIMDYENKSKCC